MVLLVDFSKLTKTRWIWGVTSLTDDNQLAFFRLQPEVSQRLFYSLANKWVSHGLVKALPCKRCLILFDLDHKRRSFL